MDPLAEYFVVSFLNQQVLFNYHSVHNTARNQIPTENSYSFVISCCTIGKIRGAVLTKNETDCWQETNLNYKDQLGNKNTQKKKKTGRGEKLQK